MIYKDGARVTSPRGYRTLNGVTKWHPGIDLYGLISKIILSTIIGVVDGVGYGLLAGNYVRVRIDSKTMAYYFHLKSYSVKKGQKIKPGDIIGVEGSTGNSTGPHLHFEVRVNGANVDPTPWMDGIQNKVGVYKPDTINGGIEKLTIVDVYANATAQKTGTLFNVQAFSEADVNKVIKNHVPDGRYWCNESNVTLKGITGVKGAQIMLNGKPAYIAIIDGATEYTQMTAADAYNRFLASGNTSYTNSEVEALNAKLADKDRNIAATKVTLDAVQKQLANAQKTLA